MKKTCQARREVCVTKFLPNFCAKLQYCGTLAIKTNKNLAYDQVFEKIS